MVKVSANDLIAILRRFDMADDTAMARSIDQIVFSHPQPHNTLVSFRFQKHRFYVLFDDGAEDNQSYIQQQIQTSKQDIQGRLIQNPHDVITNFALPFKGKDTYLFEATSDKKRLDTTLAERHPNVSRSTWQKRIKAGYVLVNDTKVTSAKHEVADTDRITVAMPAAADYSGEELPIVYMDDNVIVINKPVGVLTHAKGVDNDEFTVGEFFRRYTAVGLDTNRPGIVHRLDRDTSGIMIGARTPEAEKILKKQFADRIAKKIYSAVTDGVPKQTTAIIDLPIGRNPSAPSTFRVDAKGKPALTKYKVIATNKNSEALIELMPRTGRTHQLRVHMHYIGTPIHGDRVYGTPSDRLYLHARSLEITLPGGERKIFTAPAPNEFTDRFKGIAP